MKIPLLVDRTVFQQYVSLRIKEVCEKSHRAHILGILNILFEEMVKDLESGNEIKILNFCTVKHITSKKKRYLNLFSKQVEESSGLSRRTIIKIPRKLKLLIVKHLDAEKSLAATEEVDNAKKMVKLAREAEKGKSNG
jgi:nucleoid DNA-binding protein